ncbi:LysM peptidoglycan-binding domain-containing protein [Ferdinandcohnia sp. Marseille-Q9671]
MQQNEEGKTVTPDKKTSLPPRGVVHKKKKKKTKFKIKYPVVRLLALLFVLLPIAILSYKFNSDTDFLKPAPVKKSSNFESISYEKPEETKPSSETPKEEDPITEEPQIEDQNDEEPKSVDNETPTENAVEEKGKEEIPQKELTAAEKEAAKQPQQQEEKPKDQYDVKYHKVQPEETLYRISMKYYNSREGEDLIKRWNDIDGDTVVSGQVLRIPIKIQ